MAVRDVEKGKRGAFAAVNARGGGVKAASLVFRALNSFWMKPWISPDPASTCANTFEYTKLIGNILNPFTPLCQLTFVVCTAVVRNIFRNLVYRHTLIDSIANIN